MKRRDFSRAERIADQIQRELAELVDREVSDPRVGAVTLSGVEVSPDLRNAKVFVTPALATDVQETIEGLAGAAGFLRRKLGERLRMKHLPKLQFEYDPTLDTATRIGQLLDASLPVQQIGDGTADKDRGVE